MQTLDYSLLSDSDAEAVRGALSRGEQCIAGYIPSSARLPFVVRNYRQLSDLGVLEENWTTAYLHASHFSDVPLSLLRELFDACDKRILQQRYPIPTLPYLCGERFSLFRGCAGPNHRKGMSWLTSLDKAIWYAAHHAANHDLTDVAVHATTVDPDEIYCCFECYDFDYIVCPENWWRIDVPPSEFRIDRPR